MEVNWFNWSPKGKQKKTVGWKKEVKSRVGFRFCRRFRRPTIFFFIPPTISPHACERLFLVFLSLRQPRMENSALSDILSRYLRVGVGTIDTGCLWWRSLMRFLIASGKEKPSDDANSCCALFSCVHSRPGISVRNLFPLNPTREFISFDWEHGDFMENILMFYVPYIRENVISPEIKRLYRIYNGCGHYYYCWSRC